MTRWTRKCNQCTSPLISHTGKRGRFLCYKCACKVAEKGEIVSQVFFTE